MAFGGGVGHLTWEWSPKARLRSACHPMIFAVLFSALRRLGLDSRWAVAFGPRLLQAGLAAIGDIYVQRLGTRLFGPRAGRWALLCSVTSWFNFFCITRTFSNCVETVLTVVALFYWPLAPPASSASGSASSRTAINNNKTSLPLALFVAALAVMMRPTSVLVWIPIGLHTLAASASVGEALRTLAVVSVVAATALALWCLTDRAFYGGWTFVLGNFASFNLLHGLDRLYGAHPWHWYLSQGLPAVFAGLLPTVAAGAYWTRHDARRGGASPRALVHCMVFVTFALSCTSHKEFRFVLPLLPLACVLSGFALDEVDTATTTETDTTVGVLSAVQVARVSASGFSPGQLARWRPRFRVALWAALALNAGAAAMLSLVHQRGTVDVVNFLAGEPARGRALEAVHFLTPCHATPYHASLHMDPPVPMRFLDCSPGMMVVDRCAGSPCHGADENALPVARDTGDGFDELSQVSQSTAFERDPERIARFLYRKVGAPDTAALRQQFDAETGRVVAEWTWGRAGTTDGKVALPSHVVIFDSEETDGVRAFLGETHGCERLADFFHSFAQGDMHATRLRSRVAVWHCAGQGVKS